MGIKKKIKDNHDEMVMQFMIDDIVNWVYHVPNDPQDDIFPDQLQAIERYYGEDLPDGAFDDNGEKFLKSFLNKKSYPDIVNLCEFLEDEFRDEISWPGKYEDSKKKPVKTEDSDMDHLVKGEDSLKVATEGPEPENPGMYVCEHCLQALQAREGKLATEIVDIPDVCDWCNEEADKLYHILPDRFNDSDPNDPRKKEEIENRRVWYCEQIANWIYHATDSDSDFMDRLDAIYDFDFNLHLPDSLYENTGAAQKALEDFLIENLDYLDALHLAEFLEDAFPSAKFVYRRRNDSKPVVDAEPGDGYQSIYISVEEKRSGHEVFASANYDYKSAGREAAIQETTDWFMENPDMADRLRDGELVVRENPDF